MEDVLSNAECLLDRVAVTNIVDHLAQQVADVLCDDAPVILCVMNGALPLVGAFMARWTFLLELDYVHVTRYGHETVGGDTQWLAYPRIDLKDRNVLIVDDIFDVGETLTEIVKWCRASGAQSVRSCVLVEKMHDRKVQSACRPDFIGVQLKDKYLFGFGMDYKGYFRNLNGIYAMRSLEKSDV
ncbi:MAG: hypoxanthine-guanine phosphoribosyltransferase [Gammaproteobacteria bacterium]